jgi:hypothetical protein
VPLTDLQRNTLLDVSVSGTTYLALLDTPPATRGVPVLSEVSYTTYARAELLQAVWAPAAGGVKRNASVISFPDVDAGSDTAYGWAITSASTGGNVLWVAEIEPIVLSTADPVVEIAAGQLVLSLD